MQRILREISRYLLHRSIRPKLQSNSKEGFPPIPIWDRQELADISKERTIGRIDLSKFNCIQTIPTPAVQG